MIDIHRRSPLWVCSPEHARVKGNDRAKQPSQVACASWKNKSVKTLEMLPANTAPGTPQHQWPAKERRRKGKPSAIVSGKDRKGPSSVKPTTVSKAML